MSIQFFNNAAEAILGLAFGIYTGVARITVLDTSYKYDDAVVPVSGDIVVSFPFVVADTVVGLESGGYTVDHPPMFVDGASAGTGDNLDGTEIIDALTLDHVTAGYICYIDDFPDSPFIEKHILPGCAADPLGWMRLQLLSSGNKWYRGGLRAILELAFKSPGTGTWTVIGVTSSYTFNADHVIGDITNQVATSATLSGFFLNSDAGIHSSNASFAAVNNGTIAGLVFTHSVYGPVAFLNDFTPYATNGSAFSVAPAATGWIKLNKAVGF